MTVFLLVQLPILIVGDEKKLVSESKLSEKYKPILRGRDIRGYNFPIPKEFVHYESGTKLLTRGKTKELFEVPEKILTQHVASKIIATIDFDQNYFLQTINSTTSINSEISNKYILAILNSSTINFYYSNIFNLGAEFTTAVAIENLDKLPIKPILYEAQLPFIQKADLMLSLNKDLQTLAQKFQRAIKREFSLEDLPTKLQNWYSLSFSEFIKELEKKKIKLTVSQKYEWEDLFLQESKKAIELKNQIKKTDEDIDKMVYWLYGLSEDEIKIVEGK